MQVKDVGELLAAGALDDVVQQRVPDVGVFEDASRRRRRLPVLLRPGPGDSERVVGIDPLGPAAISLPERRSPSRAVVVAHRLAAAGAADAAGVTGQLL